MTSSEMFSHSLIMCKFISLDDGVNLCSSTWAKHTNTMELHGLSCFLLMSLYSCQDYLKNHLIFGIVFYFSLKGMIFSHAILQ